MNEVLAGLLADLYPSLDAVALHARIRDRLKGIEPRSGRGHLWSESDVAMIAYADSVQAVGTSPLQSLTRLLNGHFRDVVSHVHLLPFFPFTSDDGFAVSDYRSVDPSNGDWADVEALSQEVDLIFDLVINHASSKHHHFQEFLNDQSPGNAYFKTASESTDVSSVTRPRASPLLQRFETDCGDRWVWCTFSRDQVDWDFANPDVLYECIDVFVSYIERGASWMRIDAIAYLWKELGTPCVHLAETHVVVKILRVVAEMLDPEFKILTETNVPLQENLSYFGDGDEAHIVYNFSLPPLLLHALLTENARELTAWCQSLPNLPDGCTFLNFVASHDGIGLRPAEGILSPDQMEELVDGVVAFGGRLTHRAHPDGSLSPYEANISLFDACRGTVEGPDEWRVARFLVSQGIMVAMAGVPALYYNSLLAAPNDMDGLQRTQRNRSINRKKWSAQEVEERFEDSSSDASAVLRSIRQMLVYRRAQPAFHPEASQQCLSVGSEVFVLHRTSRCKQQEVVCIFNLTTTHIEVPWGRLETVQGRAAVVRFIQGSMEHSSAGVTLSPCAMAWFEIEPGPSG